MLLVVHSENIEKSQHVDVNNDTTYDDDDNNNEWMNERMYSILYFLLF